VAPIAGALELARGDRVIAIVNGLGSTHALELSLMFAETAAVLDAMGVLIARSLVGSYVTSLDMAGCSITLVRAEPDLLALWDAPVHTPGLRW
jgi:dihydroxyacetone kinase-like protein